MQKLGKISTLARVQMCAGGGVEEGQLHLRVNTEAVAQSVAPWNLCAPATTYGHVNSCDNIRYDVTHTARETCVCVCALFFMQSVVGIF